MEVGNCDIILNHFCVFYQQMTDETFTDYSSQASSLKAKGNALFRSGDYLQAVIEFTAAIELDRTNPILYSNRSSAFLKLRQYFYALKDAEMAIILNSEWSKGYYRKGQVEEAAECFNLARKSYENGLVVNPLDEGLRKALSNLKSVENQAQRRNKNHMRKYVILFSTLASLIVATDLHSQTRVFNDQGMRWIFLAFSFVFGAIFSHVKTRIHRSHMERLLNPPKDLLKQLGKEAENAMMNSVPTGLTSTSQESDSITS